MRIGIDVSALVKEATGIGQWIIQVTNRLLSIDQKNDYFMFPYAHLRVDLKLNSRTQIVSYGGPKNRQLNFLLTLPGLLRKYNIDVFVGTRHYLPPFNHKIKYLAIVHDLIPLYMPELFTKEHKLRFKIFTDICKHQADAVIAVSNATKKDVVKYMNIPPKKVHVIYEGANSDFTTERNESSITQTMEKYHIDSDYILCLSTVEPRKNMLRTIQAFEQCAQRPGWNYKLVIVGKSGWNNGEIYDYVQTHDVRRHVIFTGYVTDEEVRDIYANASLFVYASLCEGFGIPILEAMQSGIPVITSNLSSMPEVAGDACELIDPYDTDEIRNAMIRVLSSEERRQTMRQRGIRQAAQFSWDQCAQEVLQVIQQM